MVPLGACTALVHVLSNYPDPPAVQYRLSTSLPTTLLKFSSFWVGKGTILFACRQSLRCSLIALWLNVWKAGSWPWARATAKGQSMAKPPQSDPPVCCCMHTLVMVILGLREWRIVASCLRTVVDTSSFTKLSNVSTSSLQHLRFDVQAQWQSSWITCTKLSGTDFLFFSFSTLVDWSPFWSGNYFLSRDWAQLITSQLSQWPFLARHPSAPHCQHHPPVPLSS